VRVPQGVAPRRGARPEGRAEGPQSFAWAREFLSPKAPGGGPRTNANNGRKCVNNAFCLDKFFKALGRSDQETFRPIEPALATKLGIELGEGEGEMAELRGFFVGVCQRHGLETKGGKRRSDRIRYCRRLRFAATEVNGKEIYGWGRRPCLDRCCPSCQKDKARRNAFLLRTYFKSRVKERGKEAFAFLTLTDKKKPLAEEGLKDAYDARLALWKKLTNSKNRENHRNFKRFIKGGLRVTEVTYSKKGTKRKNGGVVPFTGWHPHFHILLEFNDPEEGYTWAEWKEKFWGWFSAWWCTYSDGAKVTGQRFLDVDEKRVGQLAKYVVKPFEVGHDEGDRVAHECMVALTAKRFEQGFGSWKSWKSDAEDMVEKKPIGKIFLSNVFIDGTIPMHREPVCRPITFEHYVRDEDGEGAAAMKCASFTRPLSVLYEAIRSDPRSIYQKVRELEGDTDCPEMFKRDFSVGPAPPGSEAPRRRGYHPGGEGSKVVSAG